MDYTKAIEISKNIYWVGYVIPNDPFQCHVYLIENGTESILIDPGSMITFPVVLEKVCSITPLKNIKYIVMHHQDPDIVGCYSTLETLFPKGEEHYIVTHWRTEMLLKHYQWDTPFWLVDKNNWQLKAGERELEFIFTPYAHFPGAFCTYDKKSKILFSSDLFGGLTPKFQLFANSAEEYFEYAKPFHQHYIPTKEVLNHAILQVEQKDINLIAPQHGSIIKKEYIQPFLNRMKNLECGLYLMDNYISDLEILTKTDEVFKKFVEDAISMSSFESMLKNLFDNIKSVIPDIKAIKIEGVSPYSNHKYYFQFENNLLKEINSFEEDFAFEKELFNQKNHKVGKISIEINKKISEKDEKFLYLLIKEISVPLTASLEKALILKDLEEKNKILQKQAFTDNLTKLYNREFMEDYFSKQLQEAKRYKFALSIAMIDIDFFKKINDTYGHLIGDCVLQELAQLILHNFRGSDVAIRYGGEEILIIMPFADLENACKKLEYFRKRVEEFIFCEAKDIHITISVGVYQIKQDDTIESAIKKADDNLYYSKQNGRNQVTCKG